jgi:hypothetical protein
MTETEQAEAAWRTAMTMPAVAELIAKDARENLAGVEVVSVGSVFAREIQGVQCYAVVAIVPDRDGKDFVPAEVVLDTSQNYLVASVRRMTLIACLEELFARVQIFGTELALAKYCQKEWPSEEMDQAVWSPRPSVQQVCRDIRAATRRSAACRASSAVLTWPAPMRLSLTNTAHPCKPFSGSIQVQAVTPSVAVALS